MTDTIQEDMSELGDGRIVSYKCALVMEQNSLEDLIVPFYYENAYPCSENATLGRDFVADALLVRAKNDFLADASYCTNPQQDPWFARVSSLPEDELISTEALTCTVLKTNEYNEQMQELIANGADPMQEVPECCVVVHGSMTFTKLASLQDENVMYQWVANQLNNNNVESDNPLALPYRTHYLGSVLDLPSVEDNLPPAINVNDGTENSSNNTTDFTTPSKDENDSDQNTNNNGNGNGGNPPLPDSSLTDVKPKASGTRQGDGNDGGPQNFTWLGVLIVIGLVLVCIAVVCLFFRRRRHLAKGLEVQAAINDSEHAASASPHHHHGVKESALVVTKSPRTRAAAAAGAGETTMSVEEDYDDFNVTIMPTHTNSTNSAGSMQQHYNRRSGSRDDDDDDEEDGSGFVEMLHDDDDVGLNSIDGVPFQVSVLSDTANMKIQSVAASSYHTNNNQEEDDDYFAANSNGNNSHLFHGRDRRRKTGGNHHHHHGSATQTTGSTSSGTYQFDLADANRHAIMGTYMSGSSAGAVAAAAGPITMTVVPPYPMDETSDSDIDSWAQTEGTVGSLDDRYEETGEI